MDFESFELAVIDLASRSIRLTVANVSAHARIAPSRVEEMLDRMAQEGRLDVELDEDRGLIFYVVRGLTPPPQHLAVRPIDYRQRQFVSTDLQRGNKSAALGAILGLLVPGVGLIYAAPMSAVAVVSIGTFIAVKMVAVLPLSGWLLSSVVLGVAALASAVLGAMYVRKYNQNGRRTHLDLSATRTAGRTLVSPLREAQNLASS
jgi:membrane protein implicated in regulation of membrane protease activity